MSKVGHVKSTAKYHHYLCNLKKYQSKNFEKALYIYIYCCASVPVLTPPAVKYKIQQQPFAVLLYFAIRGRRSQETRNAS